MGRPWDDSSRAKLESATKEDPRIRTVLEFVPDEEIQLYMNASDCVVIPYDPGISSGVAVLAMSFGKAIVGPDVSFLQDVLPQDGWRSFARGTDHALADVLHQIAEEDMQEMGIKNRSEVDGSTWEKVGELTATVYGMETSKGTLTG